jgi:hypothetical protein
MYAIDNSGIKRDEINPEQTLFSIKKQAASMGQKVMVGNLVN